MQNEKRLIDANAALKKMQNWNTKERLINCVEDAPTVDAVEVVRCRDCKKWLKCEPSGTNCRVCADTTRIRLPYDFCSYGERKEGRT